MQLGIGLPTHIAHVPGPLTVPWARRAEHRGFASLATIDRLVYESLDSIVALSVAAGATAEIALVTNVLLAPLYPAAVLAKQLATVADTTGDRLTVGLGVGNRTDDYSAAGVDFGRRGRVLDRTVGLLRDTWRAAPGIGDRPLCPRPLRIPVLFGGRSEATVRRVATVGDGWSAGALRDYANQSAYAERIRDAWRTADRSGRPRLHASVNFAFGDEETVRLGRAHLQDYYGFSPEYAALNVADMLTTRQDAAATVRAYRDLGFDGLVFHPCVAALDQVDRLADAVL
ncbi:LLM class flavin-dependent oxidoreductase [Mycobacterium europaeum]|uniref:LLM class flavin-dependent oxidoreductase n=1 Tax=Mycobacterium europaeum TaxID=761804 RepID=UPI002AE0A5AE|nr:LLM class flavin-dependent oxidoreductase [Mycobacterium europaeum]MEA1162732.1 LLM class flavin-dependent oxidoreductase [Mycobacterium europaeum]